MLEIIAKIDIIRFMIAEESIEKLKSRLDIFEIVSSYLELKKNGANYKARCPFHDEKSASFIVSPAKNIYHCFGCGAGGDAIKFVMEYEKLGYVEAIEKLAEQCNFTLNFTNSKERDKLKNELKSLESFSSFFRKKLQEQKDALKYLQDRGVFERSIEKFEIGYAPSSNEIVAFAKSNFLSIEHSVEAGILGDDRGRLYSRFVDRIVFPIHSPFGKMIGFGGRTITNHPAKYLNSPQSRVFNKSQLLYGYHLAKEQINRKKEVVVTEGYLDVIMLHQAGFGNVVATLGTALTLDHVKILKRGEPKVILALDGDSAGREAAFKASKILISQQIRGVVALFENGRDPADMVKERKDEEIKHILNNGKSLIEFCIDHIALKHDLKNPESKEDSFKEFLPFFKTLTPLMQDEYKDYAASVFKISKNLIKSSNTQKRAEIKKDVNEDYAELSILKTLVENHRLLDFFLDFADVEIFQKHKDEFLLIKEGKYEDPRILAIEVNEKARSLNELALKEQLIILLRIYYEKMIKELSKKKSIDLRKRSFLVKDLRLKIEKLKKGELVEYESCSTF